MRLGASLGDYGSTANADDGTPSIYKAYSSGVSQLDDRVVSIELVIRYAFAARDGGTRMTAAYDFRPRGALKVLVAVMKPVIAGNVKKQSASFKALCERRARA
jgi:hypothetical protein